MWAGVDHSQCPLQVGFVAMNFVLIVLISALSLSYVERSCAVCFLIPDSGIAAQPAAPRAESQSGSLAVKCCGGILIIPAVERYHQCAHW
jgi:hypothetical protein